MSAAPGPTTEPSPTARPVARSGATRALWRVQTSLTPARRAKVRALTDPLVGPLGSINGARTERRFALTFDDGPGPATDAILDVLARHRATATFFVLVEPAEAQPDVVRRIAAAGHDVGLHGLDHRRLTTMAPASVRRHLAEGKNRLEQCVGRPVRWFRPPFGSQTPRTFAAARSCGLAVVVWTADAEDWVDRPPHRIAELALDRVAPGGVLLLHDGFADDPTAPLPEPTFDRAEALDQFLDGLPAKALEAASVTDLLATGHRRRTAWFRP